LVEIFRYKTESNENVELAFFDSKSGKMKADNEQEAEKN
jgi:hypothetical protein